MCSFGAYSVVYQSIAPVISMIIRDLTGGYFASYLVIAAYLLFLLPSRLAMIGMRTVEQ